MAKDPELPVRGTRLTTAEGDWEVREVMLLGRTPLHYAVRVLGPAGGSTGSRLTIVLSRGEYADLQARARDLQAAQRPSPAGKRR
jgi:hypothetical protein